jgi:hypothetical protein
LVAGENRDGTDIVDQAGEHLLALPGVEVPGRPRDGVDEPAVALQALLLSATRQIEEPHRIIVQPGQRLAAVGLDGQAPDSPVPVGVWRDRRRTGRWAATRATW